MTTSASIIKSTITSTLTEQGVSEYTQQGYSTYVEAVTEALVERVYVATELLLETAVAEGLDAVAAKNLIEGLGLSFRPEPEPEVEEEVAPAEPATDEDRLARIEDLVGSLAGTVGKLVTLAETKLGATL